MAHPSTLIAGGLIAALLGTSSYLAWDATHDPALAVPRAVQPLAAVEVPLWSLRRLPEAITDEVAVDQIGAVVATTVAATDHCLMIAEDDRVLGETRPDDPFIPASTQKLFTAAAAMTILGPDHRFTTTVYSSGPIGADGSVAGLYLVGGGDPVLMVPEWAAYLDAQPLSVGHARTPLDQLAAQVAALGVRSVSGIVHGDGSRYDDQRTVASWKPTYATSGVVGSIGALVTNGGWSAPDGSRQQAEDPAAAAAGELARMLSVAGVAVAPTFDRAVVPPGAVQLAQISSPPLSEIVSTMLRESDNAIAEMLVKELAVAAGGPGTTAGGTAAVTAALETLGLPLPGVTIIDGSGLDRANQATCRALLSTLALADDDPRYAVLYDGLAVAGLSGTLRERLTGTALEGRLRAKTGFLDDVAGLAGFVDDPDAGTASAATPEPSVGASTSTSDVRRIVFAFIVNQAASDDELRNYRVEVGTALNEWLLRALDPSVLAPPGA